MTGPERIYHVSQTQLSIARHYGGARYQGHYYHYDQSSDTLIRDDVWRAEAKAKKSNANAGKTKLPNTQVQQDLL